MNSIFEYLFHLCQMPYYQLLTCKANIRSDLYQYKTGKRKINLLQVPELLLVAKLQIFIVLEPIVRYNNRQLF